MRTRFRTISDKCVSGRRDTLTEYKNHPPADTIIIGTVSVSPTSYNLRSETITDNENPISVPRSQRKVVVPYLGQTIQQRDHGVKKKDLRTAKPCIHSKVILEPCSKIATSFARTDFAGSPNERKVSRTETFADGMSLLRKCVTSDSAFNSVLSAAPSYTAQGFKGHDWYHLIDSFHESCDQFIPSSVMLGEDIAESGIFIDALKVVINPTNAVRILLKRLKSLGHSKYKRIKLGDVGAVSKSLVGKGAGQYLSYNFGIAPAIKDIRDALDAHRKVSSRLGNFKRKAGNFVPIRVSQKLASDISNNDLSLIHPSNGSGFQFAWLCDEKSTTATISCMGRIRNDLSFNDTWSAYLQYFGINKVVGLAWELVPFSFVVDWFTNTQEFINKRTRLSTGSPYTEFAGLTCSTKQITTERLVAIPGYNLTDSVTMGSPSLGTTIAMRKTSSYVRNLNLPEVSNGFDFSQLGLFHAITGISLIVKKYFKW